MAGSTAVTFISEPASPPDVGGRAAKSTGSGSQSALLRWLPLIVAAAYFAVMMPIGGQMILQYPDERHYAFGGAQMVETGDWLIPRTPQGEVRLKKPVVPYWFSAAGFEVLGVTVAGSRLFWVLAAGGILLLTYALARALGATPGVALLAELILAANPVFMRAATNAIPDVPLTIFVALGMLGFVRVIAARDGTPTGRWTWLGWIGMALAVLAKGLLPLVLVGVLAAYVAFAERGKAAAVFRPLPVLAALALVASWYAYAASAHPEAFAAQFFGDQVTGNATNSVAFVFLAFPGYLTSGVFSFLGWPLLLAWLARRAGAPLSPARWPSGARLLALWCAAVLLVFTFGDAVDPRYLLPVMPAFAALLATGIGALDGRGLPQTTRIARALLVPVAAAGLLLAVPEALILLQIGSGPALAGLLLGVALWLFAAGLGRRRPRIAPHLLAATPVLAAALLALAMAPVVLPDRGTPLAAALAASTVPPEARAFVGDVHTASEVRLAAGVAEPFREYARLGEALTAGSCLVLTTQPGVARRLAAEGFAVDEVRGGWREIDVTELLRSIFGLHLERDRATHGIRAYVATSASKDTPA